MTINYEFKPKDLKKYLFIRQRKFNIILLIIMSLIYFWIDFYMITLSPLIIFGGYIIVLILLSIVIYLLNLLKIKLIINKNKKLNNFGSIKINLKKDKIEYTYNKTKRIYKKSDIKKIKFKSKYICISNRIDKHLIIILNNQLDQKEFNNIMLYLKKEISQ